MLRRLVLVSLFVLGVIPALAGELDRDNSNTTRQEITGTVVFRVNNQDGSVAMMNAKDGLAAGQQVNNENFVPVAKDNLRTELDRDAGSSSWYYYYPWYYGYNYAYSYSYYYYYGNYYYPYYNYNYGYYSYYYYNNCYRYWW